MSPPFTSKFIEADRQMNFSPPREPSVAHSILANAPIPPLHTRTIPPCRLFQRQQTSTSTHPAVPSSCTLEPDCGNASSPSQDLDRREQSVADSMWANAPMPPPSPRTRRAPYQQPLSICQLQRTATFTPIETSGCTVRSEREQSVADSMWANAPMPPLNPRTRTAPPKRHLSIFQQERTASIEPSGCTARMEIIDRGNLPSPHPDLEQSVRDSMWANASMPPSPTRAASRHHQRSQNSGTFRRNTTKWASSAVCMVAARNE
jgi:hypothetical protein